MQAGLSTHFGYSWTQLCHQPRAAHVDVGQRECGKGARGVLREAAIAHLAEAPQPLDHRKDVFDPGTNLRLALSRYCGGRVEFLG